MKEKRKVPDLAVTKDLIDYFEMMEKADELDELMEAQFKSISIKLMPNIVNLLKYTKPSWHFLNVDDIYSSKINGIDKVMITIFYEDIKLDESHYADFSIFDDLSDENLKILKKEYEKNQKENNQQIKVQDLKTKERYKQFLELKKEFEPN